MIGSRARGVCDNTADYWWHIRCQCGRDAYEFPRLDRATSSWIAPTRFATDGRPKIIDGPPQITGPPECGP